METGYKESPGTDQSIQGNQNNLQSNCITESPEKKAVLINCFNKVPDNVLIIGSNEELKAGFSIILKEFLLTVAPDKRYDTIVDIMYKTLQRVRESEEKNNELY